MALLVKYLNNGLAYVPNFELTGLIASGRISSFRRSGGDWVDLENGPVRGCGNRASYDGPERRARFNNFNPTVMEAGTLIL